MPNARRGVRADVIDTQWTGLPWALTYFAQSSKMETVTTKSKGFDVVAVLANRQFSVFDFRARWRSTMSARVPESQKLKMVG